jgi:hypothetical protein
VNDDRTPTPPENRSPGDGAWANDLTEEDLPDPAERDDVAHDLRLDPR